MTEPAEGATPRTDAIIAGHDGTASLRELAGYYNALLDHARQLERELADAERDLERLIERCGGKDFAEAWGKAALSAQARLPAGPTQAMYSAFSVAWLNAQRVKPPVKFATAYKAMLAAAPPQAEQPAALGDDSAD